MNRSARALLGALLGALLALYAHPYSRTRLLFPLRYWGAPLELTAAPELLIHLDVLPQPKTLEDYSLWMEAGARRITDRLPTTVRDWKNLMAAAAQAAKLDHGNAYWHQMRSAFAHAARMDDAAREAWQMAATRTSWDDGQTSRLKHVRKRLADHYGPAAWTACAVYPLRSTAPARCIELFARDVARTTVIEDRKSLELRLATVRNGKLMRDGAKSMRVAEIGVGVVELASYPPNLSSINSPRKLLLARAELFGHVSRRISQSAADEVDRCFRDNDSWLGYPTSMEARNDAEEMAILAGFANGTSSLLLITTGLGLALVLLSKILSTEQLKSLLAPPWVGAIGIGLAAFAFFDTRQPVLAVASAAGFGFMAFTPGKPRSHPRYEFGPLHHLLMIVIGLLILLAAALGVATHLTLGHALLQSTGLPLEALGGTDPAASGFALALSTLAVVSAFYGLAQRMPPASVFTNTLGRIGAGLAWGSVVLTVVASPLLLWMDKHADQISSQKLENEPVYYFFES